MKRKIYYHIDKDMYFEKKKKIEKNKTEERRTCIMVIFAVSTLVQAYLLLFVFYDDSQTIINTDMYLLLKMDVIWMFHI